MPQSVSQRRENLGETEKATLMKCSEKKSIESQSDEDNWLDMIIRNKILIASTIKLSLWGKPIQEKAVKMSDF